MACSVSLGTLMSLTPGYAGIWSTPFSLADQVIFTILGGVNLTVGGVTEQFLWRFVVSAVCGAGCYSLVQVLGGNPEAQGVVFFILVFLWGYIRVKLPKTDIAVTFVILACVYAVDNSYRFGQRYAVNTDALSDLLKSWAFGAAISVVRLALSFYRGRQLNQRRQSTSSSCLSRRPV